MKTFLFGIVLGFGALLIGMLLVSFTLIPEIIFGF